MKSNEIGSVVSCHAIYMITNTANGKVYVGSAVWLRKRLLEHLRRLRLGTHHNRYIQRSWIVYGEDQFEFSILEVVPEKNDLVAREQFWIDHKSASNPECGFNLCPVAGSCLGIKHSVETRRRNSEAKRGVRKGIKLTDEHRAKIGAAHRGKKATEESRKKMSTAASRRIRAPISDETKAKIGAANRGRTLSDHSRSLLSAAHLGKTPSEATRAKLAESARLDWIRRKQISQPTLIKEKCNGQ